MPSRPSKLPWREQLHADRAYLLYELDAALEVVAASRNCIDDSPCRLDHEGYCQNHGLMNPCEQAGLKKSLAAFDARRSK
jgi:hypothetical protein